MKPHKHAEVIKAWANGAEIEVWNIDLERWVTTQSPQWFHESAYRVKPEPKSDIVVDRYVYILSGIDFYSNQFDAPNVRYTFDSETYKLKKAEVIE